MADSIKGEDMRQDKSAYDDSAMAAKIASRLEVLTGEKPDDSPTLNDQDDSEALQPSSENRVQHDDAEKSKPKREAVQESRSEADSSDSSNDGEVSIPQHLYETALHNGMTSDDVTEFYSANPKAATAFFEKMYTATNQLSRQFSDIGRARIKAERQTQLPVEPQQQPVQAKSVVDIAAIKAQDPDNVLIPVIEGMNNVLTQLLSGQQQQQQQQQQTRTERGNVQEDMALATQILTYIGSDHMKDFADFYGPAFDERNMPIFDARLLSPGQKANRDELISNADAIWIGARESGRELSVAEALRMAHLIVTEPIRAESVRKELIGKLKKRSNGITLRPSKSKLESPTSEGKPKDEKELEQRVEARLRTFRKNNNVS